MGAFRVARRSAGYTDAGDLRALREKMQEWRQMRGGYDAARTTDANSTHWAQTDSYSANAANSLLSL